jgi:hypothetical protein
MAEPSRLLAGQRCAADSQRTDAPDGVGFHRTPGRGCTIEWDLAVAVTHGGADASVKYVVASLIGFARSKKYAPLASVNQS